MKTFVLDCSVSSAWCFSDESDAYSDAVRHLFTDSWNALAPPIWYLETLNVLWGAEKRKRLAPEESAHFLRLFNALPITGETLGLKAALKMELLLLVRMYDISVHDASYLDLAIRQGNPLATRDLRLKSAAAAAGVKTLIP